MHYEIYIKAIIAIIIVSSLIGILAILYYKFSTNIFFKNIKSKRRISIQEVTFIDNRHKLVLIKRDDTEHLLLIGTNKNIVIETDIKNNNNIN